MAPTLLGAIAKGVALTNIDSTAAKLSLEFNCIEESKNNKVKVEIPVRDKSPIMLEFNKACKEGTLEDLDDEDDEDEDDADWMNDKDGISMVDDLVSKAGGRAPQ